MKKILFKISKRGTKHTETCFSKHTHHASLRLGERACVYWAEESAKITGLPNQRARNKALLADSAQQPPGRADAVSVLFLPPFPFLPPESPDSSRFSRTAPPAAVSRRGRGRNPSCSRGRPCPAWIRGRPSSARSSARQRRSSSDASTPPSSGSARTLYLDPCLRFGSGLGFGILPLCWFRGRDSWGWLGWLPY